MVVRSVNPRTGQVIKDFISNVPDDVGTALAKGKEAQLKWMREWEKEERIEAVMELRTALQAMKDAGTTEFHELTPDAVIGAGEEWITELSTDELKKLFTLSAEAVGEEG